MGPQGQEITALNFVNAMIVGIGIGFGAGVIVVCILDRWIERRLRNKKLGESKRGDRL